jgi:integrase/recombinase XerC/integrase/recombinase XerD
VSGVRLADAVTVFLGTIPAANTRRGYAVVLNRLVADFGADTNVALLDHEPDRVSGWFTFVWGNKAATTFNVRLAALRSACEYWREQKWLIGDPLVRLRAKPAPPDTSRALSKDRLPRSWDRIPRCGNGCCGTCCMNPRLARRKF